MAASTTIRDGAAGWPLAGSEAESADDEASLEQAIGAAIAFVLRGDWTQAEQTIHAWLMTVPREELAQTYIACLDVVARHLATVPPAAGPRAIVAEPPTRPRLLARPDPALDYAHAVLTALRGRIAASPPAVRQAS